MSDAPPRKRRVLAWVVVVTGGVIAAVVVVALPDADVVLDRERNPAAIAPLRGDAAVGLETACAPRRPRGDACRAAAFVTRDRGRTWTRTALLDPVANVVVGPPALAFADERTGWLLWQHTLWSTKDAGATWEVERVAGTPQSLAVSPSTGEAIVAGDGCDEDASCGLAVWRYPRSGSGPRVLAPPTAAVTSSGARLSVDPSGRAHVLDRSGRLLRWAGDHWRTLFVSPGIDADVTHARAAGGGVTSWVHAHFEPTAGEHPSRLLRSDDDGETWIVVADNVAPLGGGEPVGSLPMSGHRGQLLALTDTRLLMARDKFGILLSSDDGGSTWTDVRLPRPVELGIRLAVALDGRMWASAGHEGAVLTSEDGVTWSSTD